MFAPFTPIDRCIGKEITVRAAGAEYVGMLAGTYQLNGVPVVVVTPMDGTVQHHIPLPGAVISISQDG